MDIQTSTEGIKLKGTGELLKESWQVYRNKITTLFGIMAVLVGFNIFSNILIDLLNSTDLKYSVLFSVVLAIFSLVSLFISLWIIPSLVFALKEDVGIIGSFKKGLEKIFSYIKVYFYICAITIGGFIVSIIPGFLIYLLISLILFSPGSQYLNNETNTFILVGAVSAIFALVIFIWFSLTHFVLVFENKTGMSAVLKSKFLVSGNFWKVLRRFLALGVITLVIPLLILIFIDNITADSIVAVSIKNILRLAVNYYLEFFTIPFGLIYGSLIYKNLAEIKNDIAYEDPSLVRKIKYAFPGFLGALVILFIVIISSLNIVWGRDEKPIDDSDLRLSKIETVNEETNAFYWLAPWMGNFKDTGGKSTKDELVAKYWPEGKERLEEQKEIYFPGDKSKIIDDMIADKAWDDSLAQEILEKNKEMFDDFDRAASSNYFQDPILRDPDNINPFTLLFPVSQYRNIAKLDTIRSSYLFRQGKEKEAFDEAIKLIQLGVLVKNSQGTAIEYLVAAAANEMGLNQIRAMNSTTNLSPEELRNYAKKVESLNDNGQWLVTNAKEGYASYNYYKKITDKFYEGKLSKTEYEILGEGLEEYSYSEYLASSEVMRKSINYLYKPNQTQRLCIEDARMRINNASKKYYSEMDFNEDENYAEYSRIKQLGPMLIFTENPMGKILYSIGSVSLSGFFQKKIHENFSNAATRTFLAMKAFKTDNGRLPDSLNELVPMYFKEVPIDSYDGKPIRYSKEDKIIYSVGQDLKESDGRSNTEVGTDKLDDVFYEINF